MVYWRATVRQVLVYLTLQTAVHCDADINQIRVFVTLAYY